VQRNICTQRDRRRLTRIQSISRQRNNVYDFRHFTITITRQKKEVDNNLCIGKCSITQTHTHLYIYIYGTFVVVHVIEAKFSRYGSGTTHKLGDVPCTM